MYFSMIKCENKKLLALKLARMEWCKCYILVLFIWYTLPGYSRVYWNLIWVHTAKLTDYVCSFLQNTKINKVMCENEQNYVKVKISAIYSPVFKFQLYSACIWEKNVDIKLSWAFWRSLAAAKKLGKLLHLTPYG